MLKNELSAKLMTHFKGMPHIIGDFLFWNQNFIQSWIKINKTENVHAAKYGSLLKIVL